MRVGGPRPVKAAITTPARALNTIYQNLTGRPVIALITLRCYRAAIDDNAYALGDVKATTPPTGTVQAEVGFMKGHNGPIEYALFQMALAVPPGHYYQVRDTVTGASVVFIVHWIEVEL